MQRSLSEDRPERPAYSFAQLLDLGVVWLLNASVFHPRGVALALDYAKGEDAPRGWSLVSAGGGEPFTFADAPEIHERFRAIEALIEEAKANGSAPTAYSGAEDQ